MKGRDLEANIDGKRNERRKKENKGYKSNGKSVPLHARGAQSVPGN